jgi:O-antigen ligase
MIIVSQVIVSKSKGYKIFLSFCIFTTLVVLLYTLSRAAWVGGFVGVASCCVYSKRLAKIFLISTLVTVILFVVLAPDALQNLVIERFMGVLNPTETKSIIGRESVWNAGMGMFKERPLTGVGMGSFTVLATPYGSVHLMAPHDIYLFFLTEFGIIGLVLFIVVIVITLVSLVRGLKNISDDTNNFILFGPFAGLIVYFTQGLVTSFKFLEMETWALLGLAMTALKIFTSEKEQANR